MLTLEQVEDLLFHTLDRKQRWFIKTRKFYTPYDRDLKKLTEIRTMLLNRITNQDHRHRPRRHSWTSCNSQGGVYQFTINKPKAKKS